MAFVNELIPEAEKAKFTFPVSISPFDGSKPTLWKWTIDRERDAYLVVTDVKGGGYSGTQPDYYYVLCWKGEQIFFAARKQMSGSKEDGFVLTWQMHRLEIPPQLQGREDEVIRLIQEALDERGEFCDRAGLAAVNVWFDALIK